MDYQPPPFFSRGPAPLVRLGFFVSLAVLLMVLDARFRYAESIREVVALLAYPLQRAALAPGELLHPPERVVLLIEVREGLTGPRQVVEGSLFPGDTDLHIDPRLPARPRRLALRHGPHRGRSIARAPRSLCGRAAVYHPVAEEGRDRLPLLT